MINISHISALLLKLALVLFFLYLLANPFVYDLDRERAVQYHFLKYLGVIFISLSLIFLFFQEKLKYDNVLVAILIFQLYCLITTVMFNSGKISDFTISFYASYFLCLIISVFAYYAGRHYELSQVNLFSNGYFFIIICGLVFGIYTILTAEYFIVRRPFAASLLLPLFLFFLLDSKSIKNIIKISLTIIIIILMFLSGSRSQLVFGLVILLANIFYVLSLKKIMVFATIIFTCLILTFITIDFDFESVRILSLGLSGRDDAWIQAIELYIKEENYLFGSGLYPNEYIVNGGDKLTTAHNLYLQILVTSGLVGCILFCLYFIEVFGACSKKYKPVILFFLVMGLTYDLPMIISYISRIPEYAIFHFMLGFMCRKPINDLRGSL